MSSISEINPNSAVQSVGAAFNSVENITEKNKTDEIAPQETQSPEQRTKEHRKAQERLATIAKHTVPVTSPKASVMAPTKNDHVTLTAITWKEEFKRAKKAIDSLRKHGYSSFVKEHMNDKKAISHVWVNLSEKLVMIEKNGKYRIYNLITGHCLAEHKQRHVAINQALPKINELRRIEVAKKTEEARKAKETAEKAEAAKKAQQDTLKVKEETAKAEAAKKRAEADEKAEEARKAKETQDALKTEEATAKAKAGEKDKEARETEKALAESEIAEGAVKAKQRIKQAKQNPQQEVQGTIPSENTQRSEVIAEQPKKPAAKDGKEPDDVSKTSSTSDGSRL